MSDERRQQIVDAARQLYEEQGLSATTVKDISERCGVARSLFYHYFRNKQEVTSAVIDDFVNDYIESLQFWNEHRTPGDIEGSLAGVVTVMRVGVFEHSSFRRALDTHENASLYLEFVNAWPTAWPPTSWKPPCRTTRRATPSISTTSTRRSTY